MRDDAVRRIPSETEERGQTFLRTLPIFLIPIVALVLGSIVVYILAGGFLPGTVSNRNPLVPLVSIAIFFIALVALVRFGRPTLSSVLLIGMWTLLTMLFGLMNGVNSTWAALLIVPICAAGLLIDAAASIALAAIATVLIIALGFLEWQGIVAPRPGSLPFPDQYTPVVSAVFWVGIFWTIAALTFVLSSSLQRALKSTRAQAQELQELSASLEARVQEQTAELVEQSRQAAIVEERARVARDIHDTLAQGLTGIVVQLGAAQRAMNVEPQDAATHEALSRHMLLAQEMARESLAEARRSIWNLRSSNLERGALRDALMGLAQRNSNANTQVEFQVHGQEWALHADVESALLRVAQEALVNVQKHAQATRVDLMLEYEQDAVRLIVHDNGVGLTAERVDKGEGSPGPTSGFGLMGMRERIAQWGGELEITNRDGAYVEATIPRTRAERVDAPADTKEMVSKRANPAGVSP